MKLIQQWIYGVALILAGASVVWADVVDIGDIHIDPMFIHPGEELEVTVSINTEVDSNNPQASLHIGGVFSRNETFGDGDDRLIAYGGSEGEEAIAYDGSRPTFEVGNDEIFDGWGNYTFTTRVPEDMVHGEDWYIIFIAVMEGWHPPINTVADILSDGDHISGNALFEVAVNKAGIINTAYSNTKSDTARFIISEGLPQADLWADPPGRGGKGSEYTFHTTTLDIELFTEDAHGAEIFYTLGNSEVTPGDEDQLYDSAVGIQIDDTDTLRAVARVPGFRDAEGVWYYRQELPEAYLYSNEQLQDVNIVDAYENRQIFASSQHEVTLDLRDEDGEIIPLGDDDAIYYARGNTEPVIGENPYDEPFIITSGDTIRALARV
ncbi:hypothetical protein, partial [Chitinivibrio alkaliphilus]|uniref:hypothetical protein n=1 Tax=Chitinivibrio alkaliphilus TaxID=1505232 RepID=UPI000550854D